MSEYPAYSRSERIADGSLHILGCTAAILSAGLLLGLSFGHTSGPMILGIAIYCATLIATFTASAIYHFTPWEDRRPLFRRIDHAAIYLKIAGTYTPLVLFIGSMTSFIVLGVVWALAVYRIIQKLFFWHTPGKFGPALYLFMGWLSLPLLWSPTPILPWLSSGLIAAGGLLYTAGVIFFNWEKLRFSLAIWHGFVFAASACFFVAIAVGTYHLAI
ncbi:MAG: hemolysin III family protein [Amylibacter sp.]|jgi:hemolysin III|nr:hemolysin III family protein [Amylibacter sp.]